MQALFVPRKIEKRAEPEGGELPRDASQWPMRVRDEWLKAAPYAHQYPTEIVLDEMADAEKGYAFGHILLTSRTGMGMDQAIGAMGASSGVKTAKIPVIIEDFRLYPFDMIKTEEGKIIPLNEQRLGEALFRPTTFDIPVRPDLNRPFGSPLYPNQEKGASAFPILESVADTIYASQLDQLLSSLEKKATDWKDSPFVQAYAQSASRVEPLMSVKSATLPVTAFCRPDVILVRRADGPVYQVKTAMRQAYTDMPWMNMPRGVALQTLGPDLVKEADAKGMVIIIRGSSDPMILKRDRPPMLDRTGPGRAFDSDGKEMGGWLMTKVLDAITGHRSPFRLFSDGGHLGFQEDIGVVPSESSPPLSESKEPGDGYGAFIWSEEDEVVGTEPFRCTLRSTSNGRESYDGETIDGRLVRLMRSPTAKTFIPTKEGRALLPADATWTCLGDRLVKLSSTSDLAQSAEKIASVCTVAHLGGGSFAIEGPALSKIGNRTGTAYDALFTLGLLGFNKEGAEQVLAQALQRGQIKVAGACLVTPLSEVEQEALAKTAGVDPEIGDIIDWVNQLGNSLIKEAASLGDSSSVDAMLSLGFLNIDNVSRFVAFLPSLEETQHRLGTLLLAARLGMSEISQDHLVRGFFALEHAMAGLRRLAARLSPASQP